MSDSGASLSFPSGARVSEIDVSVIIVSWNVATLVVDCLKSLVIAAKGLTLEVIVVDNDSADDTVEQIRMRFPHVKLIVNNHNAGFASATNQGLAICRGRNIFLLNPDTVVMEDSLVGMVNFADSHPEIGLLGPKIQLPSGQIHEVCARSFPTPLDWFWYYSFIGQIFKRSKRFAKLYMSYWDHQTSRSVDALAGAAMLMPRRTLQDVGVLDETHPMYFEDLDYCFRVHSAGRTVYYLAETTVIHYGGQSSQQVPLKTKILILEAHILFFQQYGRRWDPWLFRVAAVAVFLIRLPVLGILKLWSRVRPSNSTAVKRISLGGEVVTFFWGLGLMRSPEIEKIRI